MSRSRAILNSLITTKQRVAEIESTDEVGAVLTLTRTSDLAITTAGTTITWQSELRAYQITWAGTDITIPAAGWYLLTLAWRTSVNLNDLYVRLIVNGVVVQIDTTIGDVNINAGSAQFMRYFAEDDVVQIAVVPSANTNLVYVAENGIGESPILNIVQLSGEVDV